MLEATFNSSIIFMFNHRSFRIVRVVEVVQDVQIVHVVQVVKVVQVVQVVKVVSLDDTHTKDIWFKWFTGSQGIKVLGGQGVGLEGPTGSRVRPTRSQGIKG